MSSMEGEKYPMKRVCVTGGTGFIGLCLINRLLDKGYTVHTTVRDPGNKEKLRSLVELPGAKNRLKVFKADLLEDGSFDAAISGCVGVFHLASPVCFSDKDPENEIIKPAIEGTLNVLESCRKAQTVKRIVVTGSGSALLSKEKHVDNEEVDESSWSDLEYLEEKRPPGWGYSVAKTRAEQIALQFGKKHGINVMTLVSMVVMGPWMTIDMPSSVSLFLGPIRGSFESMEYLIRKYGCLPFVHVEDVCNAHVFLYESNKCNMGRYVCNAFTTSIPKISNFLREKYPQYYKGPTIIDTESNPKIQVSVKKLTNVGFSPKYQSLDEMFQGMITCFIDKGFL